LNNNRCRKEYGGEMGFWADEEAASLRLARMSLHLVGGDEAFEPQAEMPVEHDDFLLKMLREIASDGVFKFRPRSATKSTIQQIASRDLGFESGAQNLAEDFCREHRGRHRDGAFFVFELGTNDADTLIYALVKYDYSQALERVDREGLNGLRRIVEAFSADKGSIQKAAIIRTRGGVVEDSISTRDRMGKPAPELTDYFRMFLDVERTRDDRQLTKDVKSVIRTVLQDHSEHLTDTMSVSVSRGFDVLRNASEVDEGTVKHAVWTGAGEPSDEAFRTVLDAAVDRLLKRRKLSGISFAPTKDVLRRSVRRKVTTDEGVTLEYDTSLAGGAVLEEDLVDGGKRFIVTTKGYKDAVLDDQPERAAR
jgi:hypothetical protein